MKFLLTLLALTSFAHASVFNPQTELPRELQARVLKTAEGCGLVVIREILTTVRMESVDQGIRDYFYTTDFIAVDPSDDQYPRQQTVRVLSAQWEINNPPEARWQIEGVICPE